MNNPITRASSTFVLVMILSASGMMQFAWAEDDAVPERGAMYEECRRGGDDRCGFICARTRNPLEDCIAAYNEFKNRDSESDEESGVDEDGDEDGGDDN